MSVVGGECGSAVGGFVKEAFILVMEEGRALVAEDWS